MNRKTIFSSLLVLSSLYVFALIAKINNKDTHIPFKSEDFQLNTISFNYLNHTHSNITLPPPSYRGILEEFEGKKIPELQSICKNTEWRNIYLKPKTFKMGIFNAKSRMQNLVRLCAIAGLHLVIPKIVLRDDKTLKLKESGIQRIRGIDILFDVDHLKMMMSINCPQMIVTEEELIEKSVTFKDMDGVGRKATSLYSETPMEFIQRVESFQKNHPSDSISTPINYFHTPLDSEKEEEHIIWGKVVVYRPIMVSLAKGIVQNFQTKRFAGIHLRLEQDFYRAFRNLEGYVNFEEYANVSLGFIEKTLKKGETIYVAVGDEGLLQKMGVEIEKRGFIFESKLKFAERKDLKKYYNLLGWDEIGLVDYLVMLGSDSFVGSQISTFSYTLANHRKVFMNGGMYGDFLAPNTFLIGQEDIFRNVLWH